MVDKPRKPNLRARVAAAADAGRARVESVGRQIEAVRPRSTTIDVTVRALQRDQDIGGGLLAGALAFRLFLYFIPYVFVLVYGFGVLADAYGESPRRMADRAGVTGLFASTIEATASQSTWTHVAVLLAALFALLLAARALVRALAVVHVLAWGLPRPKLSRTVINTVGFVLAFTIAVALSHAATYLRDRSMLAGLLATALFVLVPAAIWLLASLTLFPHPRDATWRDLVPGALLVGIGLQALQLFTLVFVAAQLENKSERYGAIGSALALLFWAYVAGRIMVAAAELNSSLWERRHDGTRREDDQEA